MAMMMRLDTCRERWLPTVSRWAGFAGLFAWIALAIPASAPAATCGGTHTVQEGESLQQIGARYYDAERKWTVIYYANQELLGRDKIALEPGMELSIPCMSDVPKASTAGHQLQKPKAKAQVSLLTGGNYPPFTSTDLPRNGLITELVRAALGNAPNPVTFSIDWEEDWSRHLDPMLVEHQFDAGFPWVKPDCDANPDQFRCRNFNYSDPLIEVLVQLFVRQGSGLTFDEDGDIHGNSVCRPKGYFTHDLDRPDRRWLSQNEIELVRAPTPEACFGKLVTRDVDAVSVNEFLGRRVIDRRDLGGQVRAMERPVSVQSLHVIVPRTNPQARAFLYRFNAGLQRLKNDDRYREIVERQMSRHWSRL